MRRALATLTAAAALVVIPATTAHAATSGAKWAQPAVYVYDATSAGSLYAVAEAASEWSKSGINLVMTSDPTQADITVREEYVCGSLTCYAGYFTASGSGGVITDCQISVDPGIATEPKLAQHSALHEMGHCIGLDHNPVDVNRSVMNASVNWDTAVMRPSAYDIRQAKTIYGR